MRELHGLTTHVNITKHLIPVKDMCPVLLSTGIEKAMPYMASKDFVIKAQDDGKIVEFDKKTNMMVAEYKNGKHEAINLNGIMVKNAGGGFYLENKMLPMYKVGQRFKKDDILAQNKDYYSYHYDGAKFNLGTLSKIAIMSSFATFEDSNMITEGLSKRMGTEMVMQKHLILGPNATVSQIVNVGDKILVGQPLITYEQSADEESVNRLLRGIGKDLREDIKSMAKNTLTSKYSGVVDEIRIYSTEEISDLSKSLGSIVDKYWKGIREKKKLIRKYKITDPSDQGSTFYEIDGPVKPNAAGAVKGYKIEHGVIIEFYIKFTDNMKPGDKMAHHLALKGTVALVIPDDQAPYTLDRPNEPIESCIPATSVLARQTIGILPTMFSQKLLVELKHQLKDMYEKG